MTLCIISNMTTYVYVCTYMNYYLDKSSEAPPGLFVVDSSSVANMRFEEERKRSNHPTNILMHILKSTYL